MLITQARQSRQVKPNFLRRYNLKHYGDDRKPAVFFGCYRWSQDIKAILKHRGLALLVWTGTDAMATTAHEWNQLNRPNIKHIAISNYIAEDIKKHGIKYWQFPICPTVPRINLKPLGDCIYTYYGKHRSRQNFYGKRYVDRLKNHIDPLIIEGGGFSKDWTYKAYESSYLGLRLIQHDGLSNTVIELGLMGRCCVWNGEAPNALKWQTMEDVMNHIEKEKEKIGTIQKEIAERTMDYLNIDNKWLKTETYGC